MNNCTVSGNSDPGGSGGGVQSRLGSLSITNTTVSGNSSALGGGLNLNPSGPYTLTNCTISGNTASSQGGGVWSNSSPHLPQYDCGREHGPYAVPMSTIPQRSPTTVTI